MIRPTILRTGSEEIELRVMSKCHCDGIPLLDAIVGMSIGELDTTTGFCQASLATIAVWMSLISKRRRSAPLNYRLTWKFSLMVGSRFESYCGSA